MSFTAKVATSQQKQTEVSKFAPVRGGALKTLLCNALITMMNSCKVFMKERELTTPTTTGRMAGAAKGA